VTSHGGPRRHTPTSASWLNRVERKAARAGEPEALARFKSPPRLAEAQYLIAQELRFDNWAALKRHIAAMTREREAGQARAALSPDAPSPLDGELHKLHIRCGSDLEKPL
jgi:hypothetical protein